MIGIVTQHYFSEKKIDEWRNKAL
jgi:chromosome segregation ATPase